MAFNNAIYKQSVDKLQYTALFNMAYHVDLRFGIDQCIYWCESTPQKLPDVRQHYKFIIIRIYGKTYFIGRLL